MFSILIPVILGAVIFFFENRGESKKKKPVRAQQPRKAAAQHRVVVPAAPKPVAQKQPVPTRSVATAEPRKPEPFLKGETLGESAAERSLGHVPAPQPAAVRRPARNLRAAIIWGEILKRKF